MSKSTREQAADLLGVLASQPEKWPWFASDCPWPASDRARTLAAETFEDILNERDLPWREVYALAEAQMRCAS